MKNFILRVLLGWQAFKNAEKMHYRLIQDVDWDLRVPEGGSPSEFLQGLNKFVQMKVVALDPLGDVVRTSQPFTHRVSGMEITKVLG